MATKNLIHHGVNESKASELTRRARWNDDRTHTWYSTTQVWSWEGGDAIVVVTGYLPTVEAYVVLRIGIEVHHVPCQGLQAAMRAYGLNPDEFQITTEEAA